MCVRAAAWRAATNLQPSTLHSYLMRYNTLLYVISLTNKTNIVKKKEGGIIYLDLYSSLGTIASLPLMNLVVTSMVLPIHPLEDLP